MSNMKKKLKKPNIECHNCEYKWFTKSKLLYVTCPNCRKMVWVKRNEVGK